MSHHHQQVFDLSTNRPGQVLARMWENLRVMEAGGDARARVLRSKLRILVAGGDGTIAWVLKTIKDLDLKPAPPVAIMPLGTGGRPPCAQHTSQASLLSFVTVGCS